MAKPPARGMGRPARPPKSTGYNKPPAHQTGKGKKVRTGSKGR